jgi:3-hydroxybutyryl-CoA dehydratase
VSGVPAAAAARTSQLAGEDLVPGQVVAERTVVLDRRSFELFAELTGDGHPIHYDDGYAKAQGLRAPIAHGLLLVAVTALGATPLSARLHDSMIAMLGTTARFISPAFVGETVTVKVKVGQVVRKTNNRCIAHFDIDVLGPQGQPVAAVQHQFMLRQTLEGPAS